MASISFKNIKKTYKNGYEVVKDLNLEIEDQEFVVLAGPAGSGKSTILRMIAGMEEVSSGEILIGDMVVNDVEPKDRDIAMMFQNFALYPYMTVYDNVAFGLKLRRIPQDEIDYRVREAVRLLKLEELLDRKPKALSNGQRQRVAMARAIVLKPKIFLLDEPLSKLDSKLQKQMRIEIANIHQKLGITILYVAHDLTEAMKFGTKMLVMSDGVVQQYGTPQEVYEEPNNMFVANFIATGTMQFYDAECKIAENQVILKIDDKEILLPSDKSSKLETYDNKSVIVGIRAERGIFETDNIHVFDRETGWNITK